MSDLKQIVDSLIANEPVVDKAIKDLEGQTRSEIAREFVKLYFRILVIILVVVPTYNVGVLAFSSNNTELLLPLKDILLTFSAAIGPALGLVVAYYFKSSNN